MMPGIDPIGVMPDVNARMVRGTALTLPVNNVSSQIKFYATLPGQTASGTGVPTSPPAGPLLNLPCECVLVEDVVEPGYSLPSTAVPSAVTGTSPNTPYDLRKRAFAAARHGRVYCIAYDGNILQGDLLIIADGYGRVQRAAALPGGTQANIVGRALHPSSAQNDLVAVDLMLGTSRQ